MLAKHGLSGLGGFSGIEGGCGAEFGVGLVAISLPGKEQAEGQVGLKGVGIDFNSAPIESGGAIKLILMVGGVSCVEESTGVIGMRSEVTVELRRGGLPVCLDDGGFGIGDRRGQGGSAD